MYFQELLYLIIRRNFQFEGSARYAFNDVTRQPFFFCPKTIEKIRSIDNLYQI